MTTAYTYEDNFAEGYKTAPHFLSELFDRYSINELAKRLPSQGDGMERGYFAGVAALAFGVSLLPAEG